MKNARNLKKIFLGISLLFLGFFNIINAGGVYNSYIILHNDSLTHAFNISQPMHSLGIVEIKQKYLKPKQHSKQIKINETADLGLSLEVDKYEYKENNGTEIEKKYAKNYRGSGSIYIDKIRLDLNKVTHIHLSSGYLATKKKGIIKVEIYKPVGKKDGKWKKGEEIETEKTFNKYFTKKQLLEITNKTGYKISLGTGFQSIESDRSIRYKNSKNINNQETYKTISHYKTINHNYEPVGNIKLESIPENDTRFTDRDVLKCSIPVINLNIDNYNYASHAPINKFVIHLDKKNRLHATKNGVRAEKCKYPNLFIINNKTSKNLNISILYFPYSNSSVEREYLSIQKTTSIEKEYTTGSIWNNIAIKDHVVKYKFSNGNKTYVIDESLYSMDSADIKSYMRDHPTDRIRNANEKNILYNIELTQDPENANTIFATITPKTNN